MYRIKKILQLMQSCQELIFYSEEVVLSKHCPLFEPCCMRRHINVFQYCLSFFLLCGYSWGSYMFCFLFKLSILFYLIYYCWVLVDKKKVHFLLKVLLYFFTVMAALILLFKTCLFLIKWHLIICPENNLLSVWVSLSLFSFKDFSFLTYLF